jgi:uncharacterized protein involved in exopolysaccharide biosynthesis
MKHEDQTFSDLLHVLKKRARPAAIAAFAVLIAMTCFVFLLPAVYESKATLLIEHMDMPVDRRDRPALHAFRRAHLRL